MTGAQRLTAHRQRHIHGFGGKRGLLGGFLELDLLGTIGAAEVGAQLAHELAGFLLLVGLGHRRIGTCVRCLDGLELLQVGGVLDFLDALGNLSGHLVGVEHHLFCHENPFV